MDPRTAEHVNASRSRDDQFWKEHNGVSLVWSNPYASDEVMILNALLQPSFPLLLEIAAHFGLRRLEHLWADLQEHADAFPWPDEKQKVERARPTVERCLRNMRRALATREED